MKKIYFILFLFVIFPNYFTDNQEVLNDDLCASDEDCSHKQKSKKTSIKYSDFLNNYYNTSKVFTKAKELIVVDGCTNTVLIAKNDKKKMYPSSMTKMMTLFILFDYLKDNKLKLEDEFTVSVNGHKKQGSKMFLSAGESVLVDSLINGIIVVSGNDAAITVAENISGSEIGFQSLMKEYFDNLEMHNSNFANCTGWPDENHYSTAYDIMVLSMNLWDNFPEFRDRFSQKKFSHNKIKQNTYNDLLFKNKNIDGIKTGHTDAGGYGIAATYRCKNNKTRRLFIVANGYKSPKERREDVLSLLTFSERNFGNYILFNKNQKIKDIPVFNGEEKTVGAILNEDIILTLDKKMLKNIKCFVVYNRPIQNVKKGDKIGLLKIKTKDKEENYQLYTQKTINTTNIFQRFFNSLKYILLGEF